MEKEQVTGKIDEAKGKAKKAAAGVTGDSGLHNKGVVDEGKGKLKQAYGDVKDTIKDADRKSGTDVDDKQESGAHGYAVPNSAFPRSTNKDRGHYYYP